MLVSATLLALLTTAAPGSGPGEPTFSSAYLTPEGLCFDSPRDLDWEALARREFKSFPIDNPPRDQLLSHSSEMQVSVFKYSAALPETLKRLHFYLLTEKGPQTVVPERLLGSVHYDFRPPADPGLPVFSGRICLPVPKAVQDAGFVATSSVPLSWQKAPATLVRKGSTIQVQLPSGSSPLPAPGLDSGAIEVKTAYILSSPEVAVKYLFVRRVADCPRVCCEFTYDIYRWESGLSVIASTAYGCDI